MTFPTNSLPDSTSKGPKQSDSKSISTTEVSPSASSTAMPTSTDVTVSTSTTTRVESITTSTSVGSDGTTTVMTEYPSLTRPHSPQSTSGADSRLPRPKASGQTFESALGYFVDNIYPGPVWVTMAMAFTIPGVFLLVV
ncbi:hypothetical protein EMPS_10003 [Entomortierella parvispora]|uniref:Uncharacterized protein n=1 Tax=Entomortierella parvispora TaxID=205924 RepID=A0A9P3HJ11_9FUNG|nr:hypothetical protein EMPS_10003 [Entomortierella parvispora]